MQSSLFIINFSISDKQLWSNISFKFHGSLYTTRLVSKSTIVISKKIRKYIIDFLYLIQ